MYRLFHKKFSFLPSFLAIMCLLFTHVEALGEKNNPSTFPNNSSNGNVSVPSAGYNHAAVNDTSALNVSPNINSSANMLEDNKAKQLAAEQQRLLEEKQKREEDIYKNDIKQLLSNVNGIKSELESENLSKTIQLLNALIGKIKTVQSKRMLNFFPAEFESYELSLNDSNDEAGIPDDSSLFTFQYKDTKKPSRVIDVNIIVSDDSIQEYLHIINHPKLVKELINTKLITVQNGKYKALEKYREDDQFCERNVIINPDLLINIIFYNIESKDITDRFFNTISFNALEGYLLGQE